MPFFKVDVRLERGGARPILTQRVVNNIVIILTNVTNCFTAACSKGC